jgi:hypothetical protein
MYGVLLWHCKCIERSENLIEELDECTKKHWVSRNHHADVESLQLQGNQILYLVHVPEKWRLVFGTQRANQWIRDFIREGRDILEVGGAKEIEMRISDELRFPSTSN